MAEGNISGTESTVQETNQANVLPHLESLDRVMKYPVIEAAWQQGYDVYDKVKGSNAMFNWAFRTAEDAIQRALYTAAPLVQKLDRPIQLVDQTLVKGFDKLEVRAPIIKEQPQDIYNNAKNKVYDAVQPHINKVVLFKQASQHRASSLKELSWQKANEVLATHYGSMAVTGVDTTSALAERLLDYYLPQLEDDNEEDNAPIPVEEDPALHTVQTVGRLSNKVGRRLYKRISLHIKQLSLKDDIHEYLASIIAVLQLTQYLNFINEKVQQAASQQQQQQPPTSSTSSSQTETSTQKPSEETENPQ